MNNGKILLIASLVIGVISDLLFRDSIALGKPSGLSVLAWSLTVSGVIAVAIIKSQANKTALRWLVPFNLACAAYMWRDSSMLHLLDTIAVFVSLVALSCSVRGFALNIAGVWDLASAGFDATVDALIKAFPACHYISEWKDSIPQPIRNSFPAVARGLAFALPPVLIFGALFFSADPAFAKIMTSGLNVDVSVLSSYMALLGLFSWLTAGYLTPLMTTSGGESFKVSNQIVPPAVGKLELNVVLSAVNLLFLSFVIVQFRYFFNGGGLVAGFTYAEYCRRGFFELSTVSALVLPLLLYIHWLLPKGENKIDKVFAAQAGFQIALLFVIMFSAIQRMAMYQAEFGLTELRFYVSAFMGWMGLIYLIFGATVCTGQRKRFAFLTVLSGFIATAAVQLANPDRTIMAVNIDRTQHGKTFDAEYALSLSNDATAYLVMNLASLSKPDQKLIASRLTSAQANANHYDLRSFNLARARAHNAVAENLPSLNGLCK